MTYGDDTMNIVFLDNHTIGEDIDLSGFLELGNYKSYSTTEEDQVVDRLKDADVAIVNKILLGKDKLSELPSLKLICLTATGVNNVDLEYCKDNNIAVCNVAGYSTSSVTQHTFALLLYLYESLRYYDDYVKKGDYAKSAIFTHLSHPFNELSGKVFGIIGLGTIGRSVATAAEAFGCKVCYHSTSGLNKTTDYDHKDLDTLLSESDIVSIHAPLNKGTYNLITYDKIKLMKKDAILLNLGRGGIVNESDLAMALNDNLIKACGLDVLEHEPILEDNPLNKLKDSSKLLITPHIAWASIEARNRLMGEVFLNIESFFKGDKRNRVV